MAFGEVLVVGFALLAAVAPAQPAGVAVGVAGDVGCDDEGAETTVEEGDWRSSHKR